MQFDQAIDAFAPALPLAVAYSGGADSTALLHACVARWPGHIEAFHVHHGLQAAADEFEQRCTAVCGGLGVPLRVERVDARHAHGESPEDAARRARYASIAALARRHGGVRSIALAQHADDQAETVLLALSRGSGLAGLSAMPATIERDGLQYHRPLLAVAAAEIRAWLVAQKLTWIEDPSNADLRYTRNRIRAELLPALERVFPQFRSTAARSARHAAQAQGLLVELARQDLATVGAPPSIEALRRLSKPRQANVLRHWLLTAHAATPSAVQLDELLDQIAACRTRGHDIHIKVGSGFVRRQRESIDWYNSAPPARPSR